MARGTMKIKNTGIQSSWHRPSKQDGKIIQSHNTC